MFQAEVRYRQGMWVRKFDDEDDAWAWALNRVASDADSENPGHDPAVIDLSGRPKLPPPRPPRVPFDKTKEWGTKK